MIEETTLDGEIYKTKDMWGNDEFLRVIKRDDALPVGQILHTGATNHCILRGYHTYIDCDSTELRRIEDFCESSELGRWYILQTSPWNWSVLNFTRVSWKRYMKLMNASGIAHPAYIYCTGLKHYAVIRQGAKNGLVPRLRYTSGEDNGKECRTCRDDFFSSMATLEALV